MDKRRGTPAGLLRPSRQVASNAIRGFCLSCGVTRDKSLWRPSTKLAPC